MDLFKNTNPNYSISSVDKLDKNIVVLNDVIILKDGYLDCSRGDRWKAVVFTCNPAENKITLEFYLADAGWQEPDHIWCGRML